LFDFWLDLPLATRLAVLALVGVSLGAFINWSVDKMGFLPRIRSPWHKIPEKNFALKKSAASKKTPQKHWFDHLPLLGWFTFARFSPVLGPGFWIRPLFVEIFCGFGLAWLYWWEVDRQMLAPHLAGLLPELPTVLNIRFFAHGTLFFLLILATLIDYDDFIIPDTITVPGTVLGLFLAALLPSTQLPVREISEISLVDGARMEVVYQSALAPLHLASPHSWPDILGGRPNFWTIAVALGCWWMWCFAMMNRVWRLNFGWKRGMILFFRRLRRTPSTWHYLLAGLAGSIVIVIPWFGGVFWQGTFSGLVGMAVGGGIIWVTRLIGSWVLGREAMGFGDVTFMAMIGAFIGWQPCLFVFFLAPVVGLLFAIFHSIPGMQREIFYGPFLSVATVVVVLFWPTFWFRFGAEPIFMDVWLVPSLMAVCAILFAVLLGLLGFLKKRLFSNAK